MSVYVVYNINFDVVHHQWYWPIYVGLKVITDSTMRRAKKGRPSVTRIRTELDDEEYTKSCGVCRMVDHARKNCTIIDHK